MADRKAAIQYMNLLAQGLQVVNSYSGTYASIDAMENYPVIADTIKAKMNLYWKEREPCFFEKIQNLIDEIMRTEEKSKYAMALAYCVWLDHRIIYSLNEQNGAGEKTHFSLYSLIPVLEDDFCVVNSLNTNYKDTGIWINPKFATSAPRVSYGEEQGTERNMANRDVFLGINGVLVNCSYILWEEKHKIENIILSNNFYNERTDDVLRVAFAPMSDKDSHLVTDEEIITRDGMPFKGIKIIHINDDKLLYKRLKSDWKLAGDNKADIFFAPEMLGTEFSEQEDEGYNQLLYQLSKDSIEKGQAVPWLTVLPSYWHEYKNRLTIVFQDGRIMARHFKHIPFIEQKKNRMEALLELDEYSTIVVHVPGLHRISFLICAEFLGKDKYHSRDYLCECLGITMLIVPSYSGGEQDFINLLQSLNYYGTTVIWGNCCGAIVGEEKGIGGCGMAGGGRTVFGEACKCGNKCIDIEACNFQVDVPLNFKIKKTNRTDFSDRVEHKIFTKHKSI